MKLIKVNLGVKDLEDMESKGLFFSDKGLYPPIDHLDSLKKVVCFKIAETINKKNLDDVKAAQDMSAFGVLEIEAVYK